jgi:hypothetical protein
VAYVASAVPPLFFRRPNLLKNRCYGAGSLPVRIGSADASSQTEQFAYYDARSNAVLSAKHEIYS